MPDSIFILAQLSRDELARAIRGGFNRESSAPALLLVFFLALVGAMLWLAWRNRTLHAPADATPLRLFNDLARELHLSLMQRWLLIRIARAQNLPSAITLLVSPHTLRHHAAAYSKSLSNRKRTRTLKQIATLRRSVFFVG